MTGLGSRVLSRRGRLGLGELGGSFLECRERVSIVCWGSTVGLLLRFVAVRPSLALVGGLHSCNSEPLVIGVFFEDVRLLGMGLWVAVFDDSEL